MKRLTNLLLISLGLVIGAGCGMRPLRPGIGAIRSATGAIGIVQQSENPATESTQHYERVTDGTKTTERIETKVGAAQKDLAREAAAKLASLRPIMFLGAAVFLFGAVSFFYPPLKLIVASSTTSAMLVGAGLALIILPTLIVGNEILIICGAIGAVGIYWFSHRHGALRATVEHLKGSGQP